MGKKIQNQDIITGYMVLMGLVLGLESNQLGPNPLRQNLRRYHTRPLFSPDMIVLRERIWSYSSHVSYVDAGNFDV